MLKYLLCCLLLAQTCALFSQNIWTDIPEKAIPASKKAVRHIVPRSYRTVRLDLTQIQPLLVAAPERFRPAGGPEQEIVLTLPLPDGSWGRFRITESPVMAPALQAKYPDIRCYTGAGLDDPTASLKCDLTPQGFHAMIRSARYGSIFIDPYRQGDREHCIVYHKQDLDPKEPFSCSLDPETVQPDAVKNDVPELAGDCTFRRYRLALACTGEYAAFHGATKPLVLAAMNTTMNRVNGIYERDLSVTMQIIAGNDSLIYLDPATDGFSNGNGSTMLGQNQTKCNTIIGSANYDIGHVFSTGGGGIAGVGVVCNNSTKARGVTGRNTPIGDPFDVDYVAHEMGHQFSGNHTQNNSCGRNPNTAMEPGSASTIMGYAGICAPNIQANSDPYFHAINLQEITNYITTGPGNVCPVKTVTGNNAPVVDGGAAEYVIPRSTPFALTAIATDPDPLTYCWEQMNNQTATMPPLPTNTAGPMFRSFNPDPAPTRYFPRLPDLVNNTNPTWEQLPGVARTLNFRVTVRDNNPDGGCTGEDNLVLTVAGSAGPFVVTDPNMVAVWYVADTKQVTWDVANTDAAPVNCAQVRILLSTDGGFTYPYVLADTVPNTGSANVEVPNQLSTTCRVMVQAIGNVFFDISDQNFSIEIPPVPTFFLNVSANAAEQVCTGNALNFTAEIAGSAGFGDPVNLTLTGAPANATVSISPNPVLPGSSAQIDISNLDQPGVYAITLTAESGTIARIRTIELTVLEGTPETPTLLDPADGAGNIIPAPTLTWSAVSDALTYQVQIATNPSFEAGTVVLDQTTATTSATASGLNTATVYYWRVRVENACGQSNFSSVFAFQTGQSACDFTFASTNVPVAISSTETSIVTSKLDIPDDRFITDVNISLKVDHSWVGDLIARLIAPDGSSAMLFDQPGFPAISSGCNGENLDLQLDDEALLTAADLENTCDNMPAISGIFQPIEALGGFDNAQAKGVWELEIADNFPEDGGAITDWGLTFCFLEAVPPAEILVNNPLTLANGSTKSLGIEHLILQIFSGNTTDGVFTLLSLPEHGDLLLHGTPLGIGGTFTQEDILAGVVAYANDGAGWFNDAFLFDATDSSTGGWIHGTTFEIIILQNNLNATADLTQPLLCRDAATAQITAAATGGTPPLSYSLNGGAAQFSNVFDNLPAGNYSVVVTDDFGFTAETNPVVVDNPTGIVATATTTNDDISVLATGGTPPFEYSLDGSIFQTEPLFENLPNGDYTVTIRDANGCTATATVTVYVGPLLVQQISAGAISCHDGSDGTLTVTVAGGVAPYQYSLNGVDFQDSNVIGGLSAGTYTVVVVDDSGNTSTEIATVSQPPVITLNVAVNLNAITANATGGTGVLEYSLDGQNFQQTNTFGGLANGDYTVTARDANGCTATATATVAVPPLVILSLTVAGEILCAGETVSVLVSAAGGVPPYAYRLDGGVYQTDSLFENIGGGQHEIMVRDAAGTVLSSQSLVFAEPDPISATAAVVGKDATITSTGGTPPYLYALDGGVPQDSNTFPDLSNGAYIVTITDANGCTAVVAFDVNYIALSIGSDVTNPSCAGATDGIILLAATGGTPPYSCSMASGPCILSGLAAGTYTYVITDALGEMVEVTATLTDPPALLLSAAATDNVITATASGGTGNLEYSLDGTTYQSSPVFPDLPNGAYTVLVRDENGCTAASEMVLVDYVGTVAPEQAWGLTIQPNPGTGRFLLTLRHAPSGALRADVFDAAGRLLFQQKIEPNGQQFSTVLDLTDLPSGVYSLRLVSGREVGAARLVVR